MLEVIDALGSRSTPVGDPAAAVRVLDEVLADGSDQLAMVAAVHALAHAPGSVAAERFAALLVDERPFVSEHAAWALGSRPLVPTALPGLVALVVGGGLTGTVAQATLESFAEEDPEPVRGALIAAVAATPVEGSRRRLVETLGLVTGERTTRLLLRLADDDLESPTVRAAAAAALGDEADPDDPAVRQVLDRLADGETPLSGVARLARDDLDHRRAPVVHPSQVEGLTVAQLFLHADIDGSLLHAGQGDTGGIATLLVHLGDALVGDAGGVGRVITISRGRSGDGIDPGALVEPGHHYVPVPLWGRPVPAADAWPLRVAVRRAMRRILSRAPVDVVHLRMADVGSWAAAEAARELGIPVVLTLAPDPHALVAARERAGTLTRGDFGAVDHAEHLAFRIRLLRDLQRQAAHLAVFPRPALAADLRDLLGVDLDREQDRVTVVPEGIDPYPLDQAVAEVEAASRRDAVLDATAGAIRQLDELLATLPAERRRLPLAISVGRLHRVKGMARLVQAWADRPDLAARCNLLVVGGDLQQPTPDEAEQLSLIDAIVARTHGPAVGLLLAGHRPNATVAAWLAAARFGVYVSASLKEEFGIAILEAMACGLVVVTPREGGPATYVDDGGTGFLVDTSSPTALAEGLTAALDLAVAPGADARSDEARRTVRDRFGIATMATALGAIYRDVAR
jgi:glycosyltransferase involved in cell wall biosynthesis